MSIGIPKVLFKKDVNGKKTEPIEHLFIDVKEEFSGTVIKTL